MQSRATFSLGRRRRSVVTAITSVVVLSTLGLEAASPEPQVVEPGRSARIAQRFDEVDGTILQTIRVVDEGRSQYLEVETRYEDDAGRALARSAFRFGAYTAPITVAVGGVDVEGRTGPALDVDLIRASLVFDGPADRNDTAAVAALAAEAGRAIFVSDYHTNCSTSQWIDGDGCAQLQVICWTVGDPGPDTCSFCMRIVACPDAEPTVSFDCCPDPDVDDWEWWFEPEFGEQRPALRFYLE